MCEVNNTSFIARIDLHFMEFNMKIQLDTLRRKVFDACKATEGNILYTSEANLFMENCDDVEDAFRVFYQRRNLMFTTIMGIKDDTYCTFCMYFAIDGETGELEEGPTHRNQTTNVYEAVEFFKHHLKEAALSTQKAIFDMTMEVDNG